MAWNSNTEVNNNLDNIEDGKVSDYNSAAFKMRRLDKIMTSLNEIDKNITSWNVLYMDYNYKIKFSLCENLYQEVESKLNDLEKTDIEAIRKALQYFIDNNPMWKIKKQMTYPFKEKKILDEMAFRIIRRFLSEYESHCRQLVDKHGMDTKYADDEDGL